MLTRLAPFAARSLTCLLLLILGPLPRADAEQRLYVANQSSNTVSVISTATNSIIATIPTGVQPFGIALTPDNSRAYVTDAADDTVTVIDTTTNSVLTTIQGIGTRPEPIAITPDGTRAYVGNNHDFTFGVLDLTTNSLISEYQVEQDPKALAITPDGSRVYVANEQSSSVSVATTPFNQVVATVPVGANPAGVAVRPDGKRVYVTNSGDSTLSIIDPATNTVTHTLSPGDRPFGITFTPDGTRAYVANFNARSIAIIDTAAEAVIGSIQLLWNPDQIAITPDGATAYVTHEIDHRVSILDLRTNTFVSAFNVGDGPMGAAIGSPPLPTTFSIAGTVTENGFGLAGVQVSTGSISTSTAGDGSYLLTNLPAGTYTVAPAKAEYAFAPATRSVTVGPDQSGVDFVATRITYSISGTVRAGANGLGGVTVAAAGQSTNTAADGTYTIVGLLAGSYDVTPTLAEYTFAPSKATVTVGPSQSGVDFAATRNTYSISGTVRLGATPLAGVLVSAGGQSATTAADGTYRLAMLISGTYTVTPTKASFAFQPAHATVTLGPDAAGIDFAAASTFSVSGRVTLKGKGLAGVVVSSEAGSATTLADGTYSIAGLVAGMYHVVPALSGYKFNPAVRVVRVGPDATSINFSARALPPPPALASLKLSAAAVRKGKRVTGTVTLTAAAVGAVTVSLPTTDPTAAPVPATVTVLSGKSAAKFVFSAGQVAKATPVTISANYHGVAKSAPLTVNP